MARTVKATIRYDGPALAEHEMDVYDLAPSLLALGDLCRNANTVLNGDMATVRVLVRADIEQQCFQLQFELVQTFYEHLTTLLDRDRIKEAKDILEWIGIVAGGTGFVGGTVFGLYKYLGRRKPSDTISVTNNSTAGNVTYQIIGDSNSITVSKEVEAIAQDPGTLHSVKRLLLPLEQEGYSSLEFERAGQVGSTLFTREEARKILSLNTTDIVVRREGEHVSLIHTAVRVRKAVMEGDSMWGVNYKRAIEAKMADVDWLESYQAGRVAVPVRSKLIVDLEETVPVDDDGIQAGPATYKILKVHGVELPPEQYHLIPPEKR